MNAQFGEFGSAVLIQKDAIDNYYNLSGSGSNLIGNSSFTGNLGTFTQNSGKLSIKGANIKTWKEYSANVCGATLYYTIYKENERPLSPVFSQIVLPWKENCSGSSYPSGGQCSNPRDQKWSESAQNIDLSNLSPANYILEVYISFNGSINTGNGCETTYYVGNYGNNYKMSFSIVSASSGSTGTISSSENYIYSRTYLEPTLTSDDTKKQMKTIQYFDGLGRPKQNIAIKTTPLGNDLVTPIEYDNFGRQVKDYLPLPQSSSSNGELINSPEIIYYTNDFSGARLYSEKKLELSPLDRLLEIGHPGTDWNIGTSHTQKFEYTANEDNEVRKYIASFNYGTFTGSLSIAPTTDINASNGYYKSNLLYKNKVTDEDGNISTEFKNGLGQTILVRKNDGTNDIDTYYIYNDYNLLAYVISPLAAESFKNLSEGTIISSTNATDLNNLCYQYKYDGENRLIEKKLPGKGWEYMVYDKQNRLVATQDANMRANNQWLFTKYDKLGRVAYTGIATGGDRTLEQSNANTATLNYVERKTSVSFTQNGLGVYYGEPTGGTSYPMSFTTLLSVNYYDQYPADLVTVPTSIQGETLLSAAFQTTEQRSTKSLPLASFVKNIDTDNWTKSYTFYDLKARPVGTHSYNYLGGYTKTETELDFAGVPQKTYTYHKRLSTDTEIVIKERFEYDGQNRLVKHWHNVNNAANDELLTFNEYNELGQLKNKKVGNTSTTPLQTVDYTYNIRGWMTQINDPATLGTDLFGYKINYTTSSNLTLAPAKYNGNIAEIFWKSTKDGVQRNYLYDYDALNRLKSANFRTPLASNPETDFYNESLTYDVNGNITSLQRYGRPSSGTTALKIDQLSYNYTGNQLSKVVDATGNASGYPYFATPNLITYDANGNMSKNLDKNISAISYNFLNLPNAITQTTSSTSYLYRADGVKVKKTYGTKVTDYLDGFQYENAVLQFMPTAEGYYDFANNRYTYNYTDHLGNVRLSYADSNKNGVIDPSTEIIEENNYYPFGLKHEGYNNLAGNQSYNYKYNGKELQTETGMYDYGARFYMPDIGRWGVIDGKSEKYFSLSPYHYAGNNPIMYLDVDGNEFTEDAWKWVNKLIADINSRQASNNKDIAKYEAQIKSGKYGFLGSEKTARNAIARLQANNAELETTRGETATLAASSQVYDVVSDSGGTERDVLGNSTTTNQTTFNSDNNRVQLTTSSGTDLGLFAHELKHMYQFETGQTSLGLTKNQGGSYLKGGNMLFYDLSDEVDAYKRGALFGQRENITSVADVLTKGIYDSRIPSGPINAANHPDATKIQQNPQSISNKYNAAFRINGTTYKPQ
ncbi:DUF6443 domain-containing protein [Cloacibacterium sp.]|uniref:DUF6443 domain-containing protein n=1 Tax=Cloacibacterium sp. TaxID=1913682 RepID=UPI0039E71AD3